MLQAGRSRRVEELVRQGERGAVVLGSAKQECWEQAKLGVLGKSEASGGRNGRSSESLRKEEREERAEGDLGGACWEQRTQNQR
ncbi:MAG: hypothetical protein U9N61_00810 [Euryarchaeota archaeon]|nr:hypothetical protein [Euryarchaeota archaeon]